jgi:hypothetical protein
MKTSLLPTPKSLTLSQINERFSTDETARQYIEAILWPKGAVCPRSENSDQKRIYKIKANSTKNIVSGLRRCAKSSKQFADTFGTIFEDSCKCA